MRKRVKRLAIYTTMLILMISTFFSCREPIKSNDHVLNIGSRLELFVDDYIIDRLAGSAEQRLHHPIAKEIVIVHDEPWEGPGSGYHSVFKDGDLYRMYYKMWNRTRGPGVANTDDEPLVTGYAESKDGINWIKPNIGMFEYKGSKNNNIVFKDTDSYNTQPDGGHPAVFMDENPNVAGNVKYKALMPEKTDSGNPKGLIPLGSPDGIHWTPIVDHPVITAGAFDSQNTAFWDPINNEYRAYWRANVPVDTSIENLSGVRRDIRTATSKDFINWSNWVDLEYTDHFKDNIYINVIKPYFRAPHILIGFPARYIDRGLTESFKMLPDSNHREWRGKANGRLGTALSDGMFMSSRDRIEFDMKRESFLRPGIERTGTWSYGQQFIAWHIVETKSDLIGAPNELSLYASENYWSGQKGSSLRRYTIRMDGFVSIYAPMNGGELITKPIIFSGKNLIINFSSSAAGGVRVEMQDETGNPIPGFILDNCPPIFGDSLERKVTWENGSDLSSLQGKAIRLRFELKDADLFSFQFK